MESESGVDPSQGDVAEDLGKGRSEGELAAEVGICPSEQSL